MRLVGLVACVAVAAVAGCGMLSGLDNLSVSDGSVDIDADASDSGLPDVSLDIGTPCEAGACGAPSGFFPVLFAQDRNTACPGASTSTDVIVDPALGGGNCVCTCGFQQPSCFPEAFSYNTGNTCTSAQTTNTVLDGGCNQGSSQVPPSHWSIGPFAPTTSACTNTLAPGNVTSAPGRICSITSCAACTAPAGMELCFAQSGNVPCPNGMKGHVIGGGAQVSCTPCTACTSTAKCKGTITVYDDSMCNFEVDKFAVDGTCNSTINVDTLGSYKYAPAVDQGSCTAGTSVATVAVAGSVTVCCP
jgi:hypothetical protein